MEGPMEGRADQAWLLPGHSAESFSCKHMLVKWMIWHHQSLSCSSQDLHICSRGCCLFCRSQKHPLIIPGALLGVLPPCGVLHKPGTEYGGEEMMTACTGAACFLLGTRSRKGHGQRDTAVGGHLMASGPDK